jgi:hydroxymethylpyrimidine pyrophosphatase-like HAD family hydrolase
VAWVNCDLAHVSKATGLARFKARTGLVAERLAGIGDTTGDMAIREHVAFFACPANAQPELKRHADYVSPFAEVAGVLDILERLRG